MSARRPAVFAIALMVSATAVAQQGMVVYTRGSLYGAGAIRLARLDGQAAVISDQEIYAGAAHEPKLAPDGLRVAFVRDSDKRLVIMDLDGSNQQVHVVCAGDTYPLASWRHADKIYLNGGNNLLEYDLGTQQVSQVLASSQLFRELDIAVNGRGVHGPMPPIYAFDLDAGTDGEAFDRCGGSISMDGTRLTNCRADHHGFYLRAWGSWDIVADIDTPTAYEAIDPQFAGNSNDHVLMNIKNAGGFYNVWLHTISTGDWVQITSTDVDSSASDFFLGQPTTTQPQLSLSPAALSFSGSAGGSAPGAQAVSVSNAGGGTLDTVTWQIQYAQGSGWLDIGASGVGDSQTLANQIDLSGMPAGSYSAAVEVGCASAANTPQSYAVSLQVVATSTNLPPVVEAART